MKKITKKATKPVVRKVRHTRAPKFSMLQMGMLFVFLLAVLFGLGKLAYKVQDRQAEEMPEINLLQKTSANPIEINAMRFEPKTNLVETTWNKGKRTERTIKPAPPYPYLAPAIPNNPLTKVRVFGPWNVPNMNLAMGWGKDKTGKCFIPYSTDPIFRGWMRLDNGSKGAMIFEFHETDPKAFAEVPWKGAGNIIVEAYVPTTNVLLGKMEVYNAGCSGSVVSTPTPGTASPTRTPTPGVASPTRTRTPTPRPASPTPVVATTCSSLTSNVGSARPFPGESVIYTCNGTNITSAELRYSANGSNFYQTRSGTSSNGRSVTFSAVTMPAYSTFRASCRVIGPNGTSTFDYPPCTVNYTAPSPTPPPTGQANCISVTASAEGVPSATQRKFYVNAVNTTRINIERQYGGMSQPWEMIASGVSYSSSSYGYTLAYVPGNSYRFTALPIPGISVSGDHPACEWTSFTAEPTAPEPLP